MNTEKEATTMEEECLPQIKQKKKGPKERITRLVKRINGDSIQELYEDILEENLRLKKELDRERSLNLSTTKELDELRFNLLQDRMIKFNN